MAKMKYVISMVVFVVFSPFAFAGNSYIEFRQFDKVQNVSIAAGSLYACGEDPSLPWEQRFAYQFFHFKLDQVVTDYFKLTYRVIAVSDNSVSDRTRFVDEHRKIENKLNSFQKAGLDLVQKGKMKCKDAGAFAAEVMKYQKQK